MCQVVLFFLLSLPALLLAADDTILMPQDIIRQTNKFLNPPIPSCVNNPLINNDKCLIDICGPADKNEDSVKVLSRRTDAFAEELKKDEELAKDVHQLDELAQKVTKKNLEVFQKRLAALQKTISQNNWKLDPLLNSVYNFLFLNYLLGINDENISLDTFGKNHFELNIKNINKLSPKIKSLFNGDAKVQLAKLSELVKTDVLQDGLRSAILPEKFIIDDAVAKMGKSKTVLLKEWAQTAIGNYQQIENELIKKFGTKINIGVDITSLENCLSGDSLSSPCDDSLVHTTASIRVFYALMFSAPMSPFRDQLFANLKNIYLLAADKVSLSQRLSQLTDPQKRKELEEKVYDNCFEQLARHMATYPSDEQRASANPMMQTVKQRIEKTILPYFSIYTQGVLKASLAKLKPAPWAPRQSLIDSFQKAIKEEIKILGSDEKDLAGLIKKGQEHNDVLSDIFDLNDWEEDSLKYFSPALCVHNKFEMISDSQISIDDGVTNISWYSLEKKQFGEATLGHEIGHFLRTSLVNDKISKHSADKFKNIKACLRNLHLPAGIKSLAELETTENLNLIDSNDKDTVFQESTPLGFYEQEDWADLCEGTVIPPNGQNGMCALLDQSEDGKAYDKQDWQWIGADIKKSTVERVSLNPHSPDYFRLLHEEWVQKGQLPQSCPQPFAKLPKQHGCFK
ncbi:MAG: hypothetical protein WCG27_05590 [Pseudomonadota bacterium]